MLFAVSIRCSVAAKQFKAGCYFNAIKIYSIQTGKHDALKIKIFRGLLYDIGMSVVQEQVHTSTRFPNNPRDKKRK